MSNWNKKSRVVVMAVIIVLLLLFLHFIKILRPIENLAVSATKSIISSGYFVSNYINSHYLQFQEKTEIIEENEKIKAELVQLLSEKSTWQEEKEENTFLREQLNFVKENPYEYEIANIIGRNIDQLQNTIIIDKGDRHGLEIGQPVLTNAGLLIGKIIKTEKNRSFVLFINDDFSKVAAKIHNQDKTMGLIEGEFGLGMKMKLIPQTEKIDKGDMVVTSGLEQGVPKGLVIGQVESVHNQPEELFQQATISSFIDFNKITIVNIIKNQIIEDANQDN